MLTLIWISSSSTAVFFHVNVHFCLFDSDHHRLTVLCRQMSPRWRKINRLTNRRTHAVVKSQVRLVVSSSRKLTGHSLLLPLLPLPPPLLLLKELHSPYGPQIPPDMWSLPGDVTIVTDPPRLEEKGLPPLCLSGAVLHFSQIEGTGVGGRRGREGAL